MSTSCSFQAICIDNPSTTEFLHLNNDCLLHLLQYIPFEQLVSLVGRLCQRLDMLIKMKLKHFRHYDIYMRTPPPFNEEQYELIGLNLKSFHLSVGYGIPPEEPIKMMRSIFEGAAQTGNLTNFQIQYIIWSQEYIDVVKRIMPQLKCFDVSHSDFYTCSELRQLLDVAPKLSVLKIRSLSCRNMFECLNFANLKIIEVHDDFGDIEICKLISKTYPNLEVVFVSPAQLHAGKCRYWFRGEEIFK